jgi:phenylalanyl-tRNA synthetase beta chain
VKFSYNWIRELVPGLDCSPRDLMSLITMKTAECEGVEEYAPWLDQVVAARVLEVKPIDGSHNVVAIVDAGPKLGRRQVVCGAPNCRPGIVTAYVPAGVKIAGDRVIGKVTIAGVESDGMLASGVELNINRDAAGILESAAEPGAPIPGCVSDSVIEVDNKSLTHRPDLWGHYGMAREVAAITGRRLKDPVDISRLPAEPHAEWNVEILDYDLCPRYSALVFENVKVGPSPLWLQARLEALDLNPISNIVDVTNYIMAELAEPMHAFDAGKLHGRTIFVRRAEDGERFDALNGESYTLNPSNLVIADAAGAVALAGVIGGAHSAIGETTTRIVLESANFNPASIRRTSAAHKLRTDASMRFEKGQDPVNTARALARAIVLFEAVCPGIRLVGGLVDNWKRGAAPEPIELPMEWLVRKLGREVEPGEVRRILESLEFGVGEKRAGVFAVSVPSWRATKDVTIKDDLLEEVGRMVGYDTVPPQAPLKPVERPWVNEVRLFHREVRLMCAAQGFTETYNYSFISEEMARRFSLDPAAHVRVANPISVENTLMRTTLLPGMHRNIVDNARFFDEFRLFEIGSEIHKRDGELPDEVPHLMAAIYAKGDGTAGLFELKRLAECLMPGCEVSPAQARVYEHPARSGAVVWRGAELGRIYELHPSLVETGRAAILDIDLRAMQDLGPVPRKYAPPRRFPSSEFDLSVVAGLRDLAGGIGAKIREAAGAQCDSVQYLYSYRGKPLPDDRQSMTFRVTVSAPDRTLSSDEVSAIRAGIIESLRAAGYDLRV